MRRLAGKMMQGYVESAVQGRGPAHWLWDAGSVALQHVEPPEVGLKLMPCLGKWILNL